MRKSFGGMAGFCGTCGNVLPNHRLNCSVGQREKRPAGFGFARVADRSPEQARAFFPWANAAAIAAEHARDVAALEASASAAAYHRATVRPNVARLDNNSLDGR